MPQPISTGVESVWFCSRSRAPTHGAGAYRLRWIGCSTSVVEADGPEVGRHGDADAPRNGRDGVVPNGSVGEQSAHGVDDRGEGLVLGELTQPAGHRLGPHERAAEKHEQ